MKRFTNVLKHSVAIAAIAVATPSVASAASDGNYCIGKGLIAYEMSASQAPGTHLLYIVRVSHGGGISRTPPIALEDFSVFGMTCRENGIDIHGFAKRYSVDFSNRGKPTITSAEAPLEKRFKGVVPTLSYDARAGVADIPSDGAAAEFQLVVAQFTRTVPGGGEYYTITQIFQRDSTAPIVRQVVAHETLYAGIRPVERGD